MDLGGSHEDDFALGVEDQPNDEKDADVDALDTDDDAEDEALGIDTEESDGTLFALNEGISKLRLQCQCMSSHYILYFQQKSR